MLRKRIIPCLDIKGGRTVKGVHFLDLKDAGDPIVLAMQYMKDGADELVFLDIAATNENRSTLLDLVTRMAEVVNIPFTVGGGVNDVKSAKALLKVGADKISVNSAALKSPSLISDLALELGSQCVVVAIDVKWVDGEWLVFSDGGTKQTNWTAIDWALKVQELGAGEILLTSMTNDGAKNGFALEITSLISSAVNIPVIASGGAGNQVDFKDVFIKTKATGALAASIFHYGEVEIQGLKTYLKGEKISVR